MHTFTLEKYTDRNSRHECPACGKKQEFTKYINVETGQHVHDTVGICNRKNKCGYHKPPREYFKENNVSSSYNTPPKSITVKKNKPPSFIGKEIFTKSLQSYHQNSFIAFLTDLVGEKMAAEAVERYFIGTSNKWGGSVVFWQIDKWGRIRTGKIMRFNTRTGKRVKKKITWAHKHIGARYFNLQQCFFGEHLIRDNNLLVAVVEGEKTAIVCSCLFPEMIWIATGSRQNLSTRMFKALAGRNVVLYPDLGAYDEWERKVRELSKIANVSISSLLERNATTEERKEGLDIADYLIAELRRKGELEQNKSFTKEQLINMALETIGQQNHIHCQDIPEFEKMVQHGIIRKATPLQNRYYLSSSTPF